MRREAGALTRTLSIPEWRRLASEGAALPVRIRLSGSSMFPLIRGNTDYVTVSPLCGPPAVGDIVLFCEPGTERYVMHRLWAKKNGEVLTWGDNCPGPDGWLPVGAVLGKAVLIERGGCRIVPEPKMGRIWAALWHPAVKLRRLCGRIRASLARRLGSFLAGIRR